MKAPSNWADVKPSGDFERLPAGGYVIRITEVKDEPTKQYLDIVFDIAEGNFKGRFSDEWGKEHPFAHHFVRSYKEKALGMLKGFTNAVEESNAGYKWDFDEKKLVGKVVGVVIGYEQYDNDRGETKERAYVKTVKNVADIRSGNYTVPELKLKKEAASDAPNPGDFIQADDIPF